MFEIHRRWLSSLCKNPIVLVSHVAPQKCVSISLCWSDGAPRTEKIWEVRTLHVPWSCISWSCGHSESFRSGRSGRSGRGGAPAAQLLLWLYNLYVRIGSQNRMAYCVYCKKKITKEWEKYAICHISDIPILCRNMCLILAAPIISNSTQSVHVVSKQRPQSYHPRHRFFGRWSAGVLCSFSTVAGWIPRVSCEAFWSFKGSDGFSTFDFGSRTWWSPSKCCNPKEGCRLPRSSLQQQPEPTWHSNVPWQRNISSTTPRVCYCSLRPSSVWSNSNTHSETFASFRFKQKHVSDWQGKMAWPPRVRILGKNGQLNAGSGPCPVHRLLESPAMEHSNHLDGLMDKYGQIMKKIIAYPCNPIPTIYSSGKLMVSDTS